MAKTTSINSRLFTFCTAVLRGLKPEEKFPQGIPLPMNHLNWTESAVSPDHFLIFGNWLDSNYWSSQKSYHFQCPLF